MSFANLEERFNSQVDKLYAGAKTKFDGGKPSHGRTDDPLLVRRPGEGQLGISVEGRSIPFVSAPRDLKRLTLFQFSKSGIAFLAKQQLLQTGNTFEHTRIINPAFVLANAIPFVHAKRNLRPLINLFAKTDTSTSNVRKMGFLQSETFAKVQNIANSSDAAALTLQSVGLSRKTSVVKDTIGSLIKNKLSSLIKIPALLKDTLTSAASVGISIFGTPTYSWETSRPELRSGSYRVSTLQTTREIGMADARFSTLYDITINSNSTKRISPPKINESLITDLSTSSGKYSIYSRGDDHGPSDTMKQQWWSTKKDSDNKNIGLGELQKNITRNKNRAETDRLSPVPDEKVGFLKYFTGGVESITSNAGGTNARDMANQPGRDKTKKISYLRDPLNKVQKVRYTNVLTPYGILPQTDAKNSSDDSILVSFAMGNDHAIQFRAFITDIAERSNPDYKVNQYIGRNERFISYVGVQRSIGFKLKILAFSKEELDVVWTRINYLTGMVFPYGFNRGIMQPNVIRLTIGNLYSDQPGYITSLTKQFTELTDTWDIDKQVPISVTADIEYTIIEKSSRIASSPFYGITEDMTNLFTNTIGEEENIDALSQSVYASERGTAIVVKDPVKSGTIISSTSIQLPRP